MDTIAKINFLAANFFGIKLSPEEVEKMAKRIDAIPPNPLDDRLSVEELREVEGVFENAPANCKEVIQDLLKLRAQDKKFFPQGSWETIKGLDTAPREKYRGLIACQYRKEKRAYISHVVHQLSK